MSHWFSAVINISQGNVATRSPGKPLSEFAAGHLVVEDIRHGEEFS